MGYYLMQRIFSILRNETVRAESASNTEMIAYTQCFTGLSWKKRRGTA